MSDEFIAAINSNDAQAAQKALAGLKDLNKKLPGSTTPVVLSAKRGADKVLAVLLDAGAKVKGDPIHPFFEAAMNGHTGVMEVLFARKSVPPDEMQNALRHAGYKGPEELLRFMLERFEPAINATTLRLSAYSRNPNVIRLLAAAGADLNATEDIKFRPGKTTALHDLVSSGGKEMIAAMVECGADVNARDAWGQTPLMMLAQSAPELDEEGETPPAGEALIRGLLELGAKAALKDKEGNDALDHYRCSARRERLAENPEVIELLNGAGAKGDEATVQLFFAKPGDLKAVRSAIAAGAEVNRIAPHDPHATPLSAAAAAGDLERVGLLLKSGADVNKFDARTTPLIRAAEAGHLPVVKQLVEAGADLHARDLQDRAEDLPALNAYEAAEWAEKKKVAAYLESVGANREPVKPLAAGVHAWEDFSEVMIKGDVAKVASALAKMIGGKMTRDAYGKQFKPGKQAFAVARPKGMAWCNVLQLAPARKRSDELKNLEPFYLELAKACGASVFWAGYSDTSDAAAMARFEPDGSFWKDEGWDRETLAECIAEMGGQAPAWMKRKLAEMEAAKGEEVPSTGRLQKLATEEKMVLAAFGLAGAPKKKVEITFAGCPAEMFDGVAFVTD